MLLPIVRRSLALPPPQFLVVQFLGYISLEFTLRLPTIEGSVPLGRGLLLLLLLLLLHVSCRRPSIAYCGSIALVATKKGALPLRRR